MAEAKRDGNFITTLLAVSNADGTTPVTLYADPTTHRLLVSATAGSLDDLTDVTITSVAQGDVFYYNGTAWVNLPAGTSGHFLKTQGAGANPVWAAATATITGTDTHVMFFDGNNNPAGEAGFTYDKTTDTATLAGHLNAETVRIEDSDASHRLIFITTSNLTSDRNLTFVPGDAARTITISGDATISQDYSTTGNPQFATIELGAASDTTLSRSAAGVLAVEGVDVVVGTVGTTDNALIRANGTGTHTIQGTSATATLSDNNDLTLYDATNDGNPIFAFGASATERFTITPTYDSGAQTLDYVQFQTDVASATANKGRYIFGVDGTDILTINDTGISVGTTLAVTTGTIELGAASDTTIARSAAGRITVESVAVARSSSGSATDNTLARFDGTTGDLIQTTGIVVDDSNNVSSVGTFSSGTITTTGNIELGHASDTTLSRASAGVLAVEGVNVLTVAGGTLTGSITLGENTAIALDPAGSADGKYTGITVTGTAGYAQAFGELVYLAVADSRWKKADADAAATAGPVMLAMVVVAGAADGNACTLLLQGIIRADAQFPTMTVGATQYVGETAGAIQGAIPTGADNIIRTVGYALTADELYFNPSTDWQVTVA